MPWKETDAMSQRLEFLVEALQKRESMSALCLRYGISRKTGYKWLKRYREQGSLAELHEKSRRPLKSPNKTSDEIEERVVALRQEYDWGGRKLAKKLGKEGIQIARSTVDRIISRRGLVFQGESTPRATKRFEREHPNDLWQMDFKGQYPLGNQRFCFPLSLLDDCSRYSVGLYALGGQKDAGVRASLIDAWERNGVPKAILTDRGTPWWSNTNHRGLTQLAVFILEQGTKLVRCSAGHPQTQGKVERFHRSLKRTLAYRGLPTTLSGFSEALARFRDDYNEERPHESLEMDVPAERYRSSRRSYQPTPAPWEYPEGTDVRHLNVSGCLTYDQRRYFVCEALAEKPVRCELVEGKLFVSFRDIPIREIDLIAGGTVPVLSSL